MIIEIPRQKVYEWVRIAEELSKHPIPHIDPEGPLGADGSIIDSSIPIDFVPYPLIVIIKE